MKFQKQSHAWLQRFSLIAVGCVAGASLLPWGFAQESETKPKKEVESANQITVAGTSVSGGQETATSTQSSTGSTGSTVVVGNGGFTFQSSTGTGAAAGTAAAAGTGVSASGGSSANAGVASDKGSSIRGISKRDENISITTNSTNGKRSMSVDVTSKDRTIKIREEDNTSFKVDIEARLGNETEKSSYHSANRKEFEATYPEVYTKIRQYIQNVTIGSPVAPVSSLATVAKPTKLKGGARASTIAGMPPIPAPPSEVPTVSTTGASAVAGAPLSPLAPLAPLAPIAPKAPSIKGVMEALDKIQVESAGNAEIERLIESIKAKLKDGQE